MTERERERERESKTNLGIAHTSLLLHTTLLWWKSLKWRRRCCCCCCCCCCQISRKMKVGGRRQKFWRTNRAFDKSLKNIFWRRLMPNPLWFEPANLSCSDRVALPQSRDTQRWREDHCTKVLQFNKTGLEQWWKSVDFCVNWSSWIQTCKTGGQPYSEASANSECFLFKINEPGNHSDWMFLVWFL